MLSRSRPAGPSPCAAAVPPRRSPSAIRRTGPSASRARCAQRRRLTPPPADARSTRGRPAGRRQMAARRSQSLGDRRRTPPSLRGPRSDACHRGALPGAAGGPQDRPPPPPPPRGGPARGRRLRPQQQPRRRGGGRGRGAGRSGGPRPRRRAAPLVRVGPSPGEAAQGGAHCPRSCLRNRARRRRPRRRRGRPRRRGRGTGRRPGHCADPGGSGRNPPPRPPALSWRSSASPRRSSGCSPGRGGR